MQGLPDHYEADASQHMEGLTGWSEANVSLTHAWRFGLYEADVF
jgi:hypothetical protein